MPTSSALRPAGVTRWALVVDHPYAGDIELRADGTLGYNTAPWARGRGVATRAVRLVTSDAPARGLKRLEIHAAVVPSRYPGRRDELARYVYGTGVAAGCGVVGVCACG